MEDLLPFSNEDLIRAVAAATTPVVSAIGHEADRPILDDVADLRASTPTDAAKRIVPDVTEELAMVRQARDHLRRSIGRMVDRETDRLHALRSRPVLATPDTIVAVRSEDITRLQRRSHAAVSTAVVRALDQVHHLRAQVRALSPQRPWTGATRSSRSSVKTKPDTQWSVARRKLRTARRWPSVSPKAASGLCPPEKHNSSSADFTAAARHKHCTAQTLTIEREGPP